MKNLPSRKAVGIDLALAAADLRHPDAPLFDILIIAAEWANGRLVDREAIDYEAEARKVHALVHSAYNQFPTDYRLPWGSLDEISRAGLIAMARDRITAAIGDTE
jgi:hypothetical protein